MSRKPEKLKIAIIGAGSKTFSPLTIKDIMLSDVLNSVPLELVLMDLNEQTVNSRKKIASQLAEGLHRSAIIRATTSLDEAVDGADFVITAIEIRRYHYWSQDFHIPRKHGFRQIYGENGGPGGMFHTLRNLGPMLEIARAMERLCPNAWMINYTNPEAKLVEGISRLTKIKVVGLCHGIGMGIEQLSRIFEMSPDDLEVAACGMNHFSWFQKITNRKTGEDLYPELRERDKNMKWLAEWDEIGLSRLMFRTYGLWPLPGANHIGEYIAWSDSYLASSQIQFFYDPAEENPWETGNTPKFVYNFSDHPTSTPMYEVEKNDQESIELDIDKLKPSHEVGIPIIEAIAFDRRIDLNSVNIPNRGKIPGLMDDMVVELPAYADGTGIHTRQMEELPVSVTEMIRVQGVIHRLVIEAYAEQSRRKLLQALLLDPTISTYNNAVALINEMCELQKEILPPLHW
jgi:alpha-galactosidase